MKACLSQSTTVSEAITVRTGWKMSSQSIDTFSGESEQVATHIRDRPEDIIAAEPAKTLRQGEPLTEVECRAGELDQVAKGNY